MSTLHNAFSRTSSNYTQVPEAVNACWKEIAEAYSQPFRTYHNLDHLYHFLGELKLVQHRTQDWDCIVFSLMYHDIIYDPFRADNESKSAALAESRLAALDVPRLKIAICHAMILATRGHYRHDNPDINYFTDGDLAILGSAPNAYGLYAKAVRKEYAGVPDNHYYAGRAKVLKHFLDLPEIFKTPEFYDRYEVQARKNITEEMNTFG